MCHMYASTDPAKYECTTRSIRLQGSVTSVRLENEFWDILNEIAAGQNLTTVQFISELHQEVIEIRGEVPNLASLLRVACAVHQQNAIVAFFFYYQGFRRLSGSRAGRASPFAQLGGPARLGIVDRGEQWKMEVITGADTGLAGQLIAVTDQFGTVLLEKPGQQAVDHQGAE